MAHDVTAPAERADRESATDNLAEGREVGRNAEQLGRAAAGEAEAADHFIENQERSRTFRLAAKRG